MRSMIVLNLAHIHEKRSDICIILIHPFSETRCTYFSVYCKAVFAVVVRMQLSSDMLCLHSFRERDTMFAIAF